MSVHIYQPLSTFYTGFEEDGGRNKDCSTVLKKGSGENTWKVRFPGKNEKDGTHASRWYTCIIPEGCERKECRFYYARAYQSDPRRKGRTEREALEVSPGQFQSPLHRQRCRPFPPSPSSACQFPLGHTVVWFGARGGGEARRVATKIDSIAR